MAGEEAGVPSTMAPFAEISRLCGTSAAEQAGQTLCQLASRSAQGGRLGCHHNLGRATPVGIEVSGFDRSVAEPQLVAVFRMGRQRHPQQNE